MLQTKKMLQLLKRQVKNYHQQNKCKQKKATAAYKKCCDHKTSVQIQTLQTQS